MAAGGMNRKLGPLPVWAWGLILGVGGYMFYRYYKSGSSTTTGSSPTGTVLDPNAVDPNTGLTYGQEESAAMNANATSPATGSLGSSGGGTDTGSTSGPSLTGELNDLQAIVGLMQQINPNLGQTPTGSGTGGNTYNITVPANPPPTTPTTPPPLPSPVLTSSQIAKQLASSAGVGGQQATSFISSIVSQGFKPGKGAAAGTYTKPGSSAKYFVFQLGGQTHVRQAQPPTPSYTSTGGKGPVPVPTKPLL